MKSKYKISKRAKELLQQIEKIKRFPSATLRQVCLRKEDYEEICELCGIPPGIDDFFEKGVLIRRMNHEV
jgi:hypothetical protein